VAIPLARYRRIVGHVLPQWPALLAVVGLSAVLSVSAALQPWPLKILVDNALGDAPVPDVVRSLLQAQGMEPAGLPLVTLAALASVAVFALTALLDAGLTMAWSHAGQRMVFGLATDLYLQLQRLSLLFHARRTVGDSLSRVIGDTWCVYTVTDCLLVNPVRQLTVLASVGVLAWQLDRGLTLLMLVAVPALAASAIHFGNRLKAAEARRRESAAQVTAFVHQVLGAMPVVQAFGAGARNLRLYGALAEREVQATRAGVLVGNAFGVVNGIATTIGVTVIVYAGGRQVLDGAMTLGSLLVFIAYARTLDEACRSLISTYGSLRSAEASVDRVLEVLEAKEMVRDAPDARPLPPRDGGPRGHLVFDRVSFGYEPDRPVLREVSFDVRPGETVALVGASGAGKSTLASLVPRFFDPWQGRVLLDGADVRATALASLRAELALVLQDPFILPMSVAENIAYGRPAASREEIVACAVAANAHPFIRELPDGYDTVLGDQGADLSGGQRQRIAIARALLKNPRVLILDEPTSALDAESERVVMDALARLRAGRTTLIIAHRLATIRSADRIAVLDEGRLVELGTHEQLLAAGGAYARLHALSLLGAAEGDPA
jgi:ATP-binding cassette, subfamily B, bacterial